MENRQQIRERAEKFLKKENLVVFVLVGVLLFVIAAPVNGETKETKETAAGAENQSAKAKEDDLDASEAYRLKLQRELEAFLSKIDSVGKVKVYITMEQSVEYVLDGQYVVTRKMPKVQGVLVVAQGADIDRNRSVIANMLQAALDLEPHKVQVTKMARD